MPLIAGTSIGDGMKSMTASSSACTPLFLNAEPHIATTISLDSVRCAQALANLVFRQARRLEKLLQQLLIGLGGGLDHLLAPFLGLGQQLFGDVDFAS